MNLDLRTKATAWPSEHVTVTNSDKKNIAKYCQIDMSSTLYDWHPIAVALAYG